MSSRRRRTRKLLAIAAHTLRAVLLLSLILALAALFIWTKHRPYINTLDERIVAGYVEPYKAKYFAATSLMKESKYPEARNAFEALIESMGQVRTSDRLAVIYRKTLSFLWSAYSKTGEPEQALRAAKALVEFDPKYYKGWLIYARELDLNQQRESAIGALYRAYRIVPYSTDITVSLARALHSVNRRGEAKEVLQDWLDANMSMDLVVYYAYDVGAFTEDGTVRSSSKKIVGKERRWMMEARIEESGITKLRLDFPEVPGVNVRVHSLALITSKGRVGLSPNLGSLSFHDIKATGRDSFTISGPDPYILLPLPQPLWNVEIEALEAELEIVKQLPQDLLPLMEGM
jgi:tetratricopeptide (TPR) repeat protein